MLDPKWYSLTNIDVVWLYLSMLCEQGCSIKILLNYRTPVSVLRCRAIVGAFQKLSGEGNASSAVANTLQYLRSRSVPREFENILHLHMCQTVMDVTHEALHPHFIALDAIDTKVRDITPHSMNC